LDIMRRFEYESDKTFIFNYRYKEALPRINSDILDPVLWAGDNIISFA